MITVFIMTYLGYLAIMDAVRREVSVRTLVIGTIVATLLAGWFLKSGTITWESLAFGAIPGVILLAISGMTKGAGVGDAIILLQMDLVLLWDHLVMAFGISLFVMACFSAGILLLKKGSKDTRLPYLPFLWIGYVGALCVRG